MRSRLPLAAFVASALAASACDFIPGGYSCTAEAVPGISVDVRDSVPLTARLQS